MLRLVSVDIGAIIEVETRPTHPRTTDVHALFVPPASGRSVSRMGDVFSSAKRGWHMPKGILAGLDGSDLSEEILPYVAQMATPGSTKVILFKVLPESIGGAAGVSQRTP